MIQKIILTEKELEELKANQTINMEIKIKCSDCGNCIKTSLQLVKKQNLESIFND